MGRPKRHIIPYCGDREQMEKVFREYLDYIVDCFGAVYDDRKGVSESASLRSVCEEFGISIPKARKLLITAGVYSTEASRRVAELSASGRSLEEIMAETGLSRSSVSSYQPYQKVPYNMAEVSRHAADSRKYRERRKAVRRLQDQIHAGGDVEDALWQTVIAYQNYPFRTSSGLTFSYTVRQKKNGEYSGELLISRKESSKTLTKSSMLLALQRVLEHSSPEPPLYAGPKAIGQIFGISYIYSLFWKWNLIRVPEKVEKKLQGKR
ncbi:MAG: hypothetical protein MR636_10510 [Clostridiales bacterium]|nr:hypothetical protein [Clostridiales bacterium]